MSGWCSNVAWVCAHLWFIVHTVWLLDGIWDGTVEWTVGWNGGMEQWDEWWDGKWNGRVNVVKVWQECRVTNVKLMWKDVKTCMLMYENPREIQQCKCSRRTPITTTQVDCILHVSIITQLAAHATGKYAITTCIRTTWGDTSCIGP